MNRSNFCIYQLENYNLPEAHFVFFQPISFLYILLFAFPSLCVYLIHQTFSLFITGKLTYAWVIKYPILYHISIQKFPKYFGDIVFYTHNFLATKCKFRTMRNSNNNLFSRRIENWYLKVYRTRKPGIDGKWVKFNFFFRNRLL